MRVAVIGSGNIGGTLAKKFAAAGHQVTIGSREPEARAEQGVTTAAIADALRDADVVVLAIPGTVVADFARENMAALSGMLVDATNNMSAVGPPNAHRALIATAPDIRYAHAFNSLGWENFDNPRYGDQVGDLLFSAPEADRAAVEQLIDAVGLRPMYLGDNMADTLDGLLPVWFTLSKLRGRHLAFKVLDDSIAEAGR